jgi:hypothetical protein
VLRPPEFSLPLTVLRFNLQEFIGKRYPKKNGYLQISLDHKLPMAIDTKYVLKGELCSDISLYSLNYSVFINDEKFSKPEIKFLGITYWKRFKSSSRNNLIKSLKETEVSRFFYNAIIVNAIID